MAVLCRASGSGNIPGEGCGGEEDLAGSSTSFAHGIPCSANASAASGRLIAEESAGAGLLDLDLLPVRFEFLRKNHRERGADALAHLRARDDDCDLVVGRDPQIGVGREEFFFRTTPMRQVETDDETGSGRNPDGDESTT